MPVWQSVDYSSQITLQILWKGLKEVCSLYFQKALRCLVTSLDQFLILIYFQISFVSQLKSAVLTLLGCQIQKVALYTLSDGPF